MIRKCVLIALAMIAMLGAGPAAAQEYIVTAKPGLKAINLYDAPNGRLVKTLKPSEIVNVRIQKRAGPWCEIDVDFDQVWIAAGDLITRSGPIRNQPGKTIDLTGAASRGIGIR